jgi:hypothetical protein
VFVTSNHKFDDIENEGEKKIKNKKSTCTGYGALPLYCYFCAGAKSAGRNFVTLTLNFRP